MTVTDSNLRFTEVTGPDWDLVPFDVPCARCGHDLRGLADPVCPACELEFDWSVAVPIEKLTCGKCDYRLFGLTEMRCPECGERFTWERALAAYERRRHLLFEYRWRDRPIRSLIRTAYLMFRPRLLWQQLDIHDRPRVRPLIVMAAQDLVPRGDGARRSFGWRGRPIQGLNVSGGPLAARKQGHYRRSSLESGGALGYNGGIRFDNREISVEQKRSSDL